MVIRIERLKKEFLIYDAKLPDIIGLSVGYNHCELFDIGHVSKYSKEYKNTHGTRLYYDFTVILLEYVECGDYKIDISLLFLFHNYHI